MQHKRFSTLRLLLGVAAFLSVVLLFVGNLQAFTDYLKLRTYSAPGDVATLAGQTTMTDYGRKLFYVNHPALADRSSFNGACNSRGEHTIVLGCYKSVDRGIYLFDVSDARLNGVEQVTAAHEMLHAAYDRLSSKEKADIDEQLQNFYEHQVTDKRIRDTIAAYQVSEPNDVQNEMHSIFATEMTTLPPELDRYYRKYFTDRQKVVQYANSYQSEFTSRQDKITAYDRQLADLKDSIDSATTELSRREGEISAMQRQMNSLKGADSIDEYNALVPAYNAKVDQYNAMIKSTQSNISRYNSIVQDRNALATEIRGLTQSISSQLTQISQ
jgi:uncharacterized protein YdaU (DUF1376 family)